MKGVLGCIYSKLIFLADTEDYCTRDLCKTGQGNWHTKEQVGCTPFHYRETANTANQSQQAQNTKFKALEDTIATHLTSLKVADMIQEERRKYLLCLDNGYKSV